MNDSHAYEVNLTWDSLTLGTLSSPVLPVKIEIATPPEFPNGIKDKWTPEHLYVASVNACLMATFLSIADNSNFNFISFDCNATGKIEKVNEQLLMTEILLKPTLVIPSSETMEKANYLLEMSQKSCAVANSIKTSIKTESKIIIQNQQS